MAIITKKDFKPHPAVDDPIKAVIVDVTEPREVDGKYGKQLKFSIVFETELLNPENNGNHWIYFANGYTASTGERSNFTKDLKKILEIEKVPEEFDTETLLGKSVKIIIEHKAEGDKVYANHSWIKGDSTPTAMKPSGKYTRKADRDAGNTGSTYTKAPAVSGGGNSTPAGTGINDLPWNKVKVHVGKYAGKELEDVPKETVERLIQHWIPTVTTALPEGTKVTADDKRLLKALEEAQVFFNKPAPDPAADLY